VSGGRTCIAFGIRSLSVPCCAGTTGVDPMSRFFDLSTFIGHVSPASTAVYLTITTELLECAGMRFQRERGHSRPVRFHSYTSLRRSAAGSTSSSAMLRSGFAAAAFQQRREMPRHPFDSRRLESCRCCIPPSPCNAPPTSSSDTLMSVFEVAVWMSFHSIGVSARLGASPPALCRMNTVW